MNGGTIQFREIWKCLLPRSLILIVGNFTSHSPKVGLLNMRGLGGDNCSVIPLRFTHIEKGHDIFQVLAILLMYHTSPWVDPLFGLICFLKLFLFNLARQQDSTFSASPLPPRQRDNHIISFFRKTCGSVLPLISPLQWEGTGVLFQPLFSNLFPSLKTGLNNNIS